MHALDVIRGRDEDRIVREWAHELLDGDRATAKRIEAANPDVLPPGLVKDDDVAGNEGGEGPMDCTYEHGSDVACPDCCPCDACRRVRTIRLLLDFFKFLYGEPRCWLN